MSDDNDIFAEIDRLTLAKAKSVIAYHRWGKSRRPICPKCGGRKHYNITTRGRYRCATPECRNEYTVTSGTPLAYSKMSYHQMLKCIALADEVGTLTLTDERIRAVVGVSRAWVPATLRLIERLAEDTSMFWWKREGLQDGD